LHDDQQRWEKSRMLQSGIMREAEANLDFESEGRRKVES
jgi:hypothetical protein